MKTLNSAPVRTSQAGFTLIELIMVIVILGILSAVAAPKFLDLTGDAQKAASESIHGTIQSTMSVAFASHRAGGLTGTGDGDDAYITNCTSLENFLDGGLPNGTTCDGTVVTFPDARTATITAETNTSRASLSALP